MCLNEKIRADFSILRLSKIDSHCRVMNFGVDGVFKGELELHTVLVLLSFECLLVKIQW